MLLCITGVGYSQVPTPTPLSVIVYGAGDSQYDGVYCPAGKYNTCFYYNNRLNGNYQLRYGDAPGGSWKIVDLGVSQYELVGNCATSLTSGWTASGGAAPAPLAYMGVCAPTPLTSPTPTPAETPTPTPTVTPTAIPSPSVTPTPSPTPVMKPHSGTILGTQLIYGKVSQDVYQPIKIEADGSLKTR